jgi:hypothetical protein
MALNYFNRYRKLNSDEKRVSPPFIKLDTKQSDKFTTYTVNKSRLDKLSQQHYGAPYYGWLILMANPELGSSEWEFPDNSTIRIPYPLQDTLREYDAKLKNRLDYYGS